MKFLTLFLTLIISGSVFADVGYVNIEKILTDTKAGKEIQKKVNKELESRRSSIQKKKKNCEIKN